MSLTLAIVTCGPQLEVALLGGGRQRAPSLARLAGVAPRSTLLLAAVDLLFEDLGIEPQSLSRVLVSRGPGSFTGIRAGLASAAGLAAASSAAAAAFDSMTMQAARCRGDKTVWAAQPGRRGEVYAQPFQLEPGGPPRAIEPIRTMAITATEQHGPWAAAESLDLGAAPRATAVRAAAEALLHLDALSVPAEPLQPLYVEGPPVPEVTR